MATFLESMMAQAGNMFKGNGGNNTQQNANPANGAPRISNPGLPANSSLAQGTGIQPPATSQNAQGQNGQNPGNNQQANNGPSNEPNNNPNQQVNSGTQNQSPLDMFSKMWENKDTGNGNGNGNNSQSIFTPDMAKLNEAVKGIDFTKNIDPNLITKALSGDVQAFGQVLNQALQGSFSQSLIAGSQIAERGMTTVRGHIEKGFDGRIKNFTASDRLQSSNKNFNHPAFKPLLNAIQSQISANFPEATPDEIVQYSQQYMEGISGMMNGKSDGNNSMQNPGPAADDNSQNSNWGNFFG